MMSLYNVMHFIRRLTFACRLKTNSEYCVTIYTIIEANESAIQGNRSYSLLILVCSLQMFDTPVLQLLEASYFIALCWKVAVMCSGLKTLLEFFVSYIVYMYKCRFHHYLVNIFLFSCIYIYFFFLLHCVLQPG